MSGGESTSELLRVPGARNFLTSAALSTVALTLMLAVLFKQAFDITRDPLTIGIVAVSIYVTIGIILGSLAGSLLGGGRSGGGLGSILGSMLGGGGGSSAPAVSDQQRQAANEDAEILIRAMCNAAKADGQIDQSEIDAITSRLGDIDEHEAAFLRRELQAPLDLEAFCDSVPSDLTQQAYAFSLLGMKLDTQREAQYLGAVAQGLRLDGDTCNAIHDKLQAPRIFK